MSEKKPIKKLTIRIDEELHRELQHYVIDEKTSIQELTINFYKKLLNKGV